MNILSLLGVYTNAEHNKMVERQLTISNGVSTLKYDSRYDKKKSDRRKREKSRNK